MTGWSWLTPEENAALDALWAEEEAEEQVAAALKPLADAPAVYPPALLSARRAAFIAQIPAHGPEWTPDAFAAGEQNAHEVAIATALVNLANCKPTHRWYYIKRLREEREKAASLLDERKTS